MESYKLKYTTEIRTVIQIVIKYETSKRNQDIYFPLQAFIYDIFNKTLCK